MKEINDYSRVRRPFAYPVNVIKKRDAFKPAPLSHKEICIPRIEMQIPFRNGKSAYLQLPGNYCDRDIEIILAQLDVIKMSIV